jgi:hypothetical protein
MDKLKSGNAVFCVSVVFLFAGVFWIMLWPLHKACEDIWLNLHNHFQRQYWAMFFYLFLSAAVVDGIAIFGTIKLVKSRQARVYCIVLFSTLLFAGFTSFLVLHLKQLALI